jgi:predicted metalloprotease with PDZ domain
VVARIRAPEPEDHLVHVELDVPPLPVPGSRELMLPRWIPGSYVLRNFARFVQDLAVEDADGNALPTTRSATDRWRFDDPATGNLRVSYSVYCRDLTVDTSHVTSTHLYVHGVTTFLYDAATRSMPWRVELEVPSDWSIWTGLPAAGRTRAGFPALRHRATFLATDYDHLIDCPIEAGPAHHVETFRAAGKPHRFVVWNPPESVDWRHITKDVRRIIEEACAIFTGAPYRDYTFILHVAREYGGGLEHDNSTVLGADPLHLLEKKAYHTRFLPLVAHEYFHVWNVRRIKPQRFLTMDLQQEVPTGLLWLFEGGTTYYEFPLMLRAGIPPEKVYETLTELVKYVDGAPGRHRISVSDASRLAWVKLYARHESNVNTNVSYYAKGALVCLCLDAHLRARGANLDQVMRYIWKEVALKGAGIEEDGFPRLVKEATGIDVARQLKRWVEEPGELPLEQSMRTLGLKLERKHSDPDANLGLGIILAEDDLRVLAVPDRWDTKDGRWRQGANAVPHPLDPDDQILAVDGWKVDMKALARHVNVHEEGEDAVVSIFRDGRMRTLRVPVVEKIPDKVKVEEDKDAAADAKRRRTAWKRRRSG